MRGSSNGSWMEARWLIAAHYMPLPIVWQPLSSCLKSRSLYSSACPHTSMFATPVSTDIMGPELGAKVELSLCLSLLSKAGRSIESPPLRGLRRVWPSAMINLQSQSPRELPPQPGMIRMHRAICQSSTNGPFTNVWENVQVPENNICLAF